MSKDLKASVIIPTHNRGSILLKVLACYAVQTAPSERFEILVINDGGSDDTPGIFSDLTSFKTDGYDTLSEKQKSRIEYASQGSLAEVLRKVPVSNESSATLRYIEISKSGRSCARNVGICFSSNPLIIFADDDIFVEPGFVKKHLESHEPGDRLVVSGRVIHTSNLEDPFSARWKPKDINSSFLATGNASVMKEHIVRAGCFDERYEVYGWEDFDLGVHLEKEGLKSVKRKIYGYHYDPKPGVLSPAEIYRKEKERGSTAVYFYKSHPLPWVRRFTLVDNSPFRVLFSLLGRNNWFLKKKKISVFKGLFKLIIRYKGYFDGIEEAKYGRIGEEKD